MNPATRSTSTCPRRSCHDHHSDRAGLRPPAPSSVSPEAKYYLTLIQDVAPLLYPEAADEAAWDKWIALQENALHTKFTAALPPDDHYRHARSIVAGVPVHVVTPASVPNGDETPLFLQLHGGAMVMGGGDLAWMESATLASRRPGVTWVPDYRMLPRHPYPAALDDAIAVYRAALKTRAPQRIVVVGASAGGNLAAALLMRARDEGLPLPAALVLQTPEVDLTESGDTFRTNVGIDILGSLMPLNMLYAGGHQLTHPYLSPLFGLGRTTADLPAERHPRPVPVEYGPNAPTAPGVRRRGGAAHFRGNAARRFHRECTRGPRTHR